MPIIELPEESTIEEILSPTGETKVQRTKKRTIKKKKGDKQETIEIITIDEDDKDSVTSIVINEIQLSPEQTWPDEKDAEIAIVIRELPEEEVIIPETSDDTKKTVKKRTLKKKVGKAHETTEIITVLEDKLPVHTEVVVTLSDVELEEVSDYETEPKDLEQADESLEHPEESTEEVMVTQYKPKDKKPKKDKKKRSKVEPQPSEEEAPEEHSADVVEEQPEHVSITEEQTDENVTKKITKKRITKKKVLDEEQTAEIIEQPSEFLEVEQLPEEVRLHLSEILTIHTLSFQSWESHGKYLGTN